MSLWVYLLALLLVYQAGTCVPQPSQTLDVFGDGSLDDEDGSHSSFEGEFLPLFANTTELLAWYLEAYREGIYHRHLAADRMEAMLAVLLHRRQVSSENESNRGGMPFPSPRDLGVTAGGQVSVVLLSVLGAMPRSAMLASGSGNRGRAETWGEVLDPLATHGARLASGERTCTSLGLDGDVPEMVVARLRFGSHAVQLRIEHILVHGYLTTADEDKALLAAAEWEGARARTRARNACASCWWEQGKLTREETLDLRRQVAGRQWLRRAHARLAQDCPADQTNGKEQRLPTSSSFDPPPSLHCTDSADNDTLDKFLAWCEEQELYVNKKLAFQMLSSDKPSNEDYDLTLPPGEAAATSASTGYEEEKVRGVVAIEMMKAEEIVCTLPHKLALFDRAAKGGGNWDTTAAALVRERRKGKASLWYPYISVLPCQDPSALGLDAKEILELQWWPAVRESVMFRKATRERYRALGGADAMLGASLEEYMWAVGMVNSRAYTLPVGADGHYVQYAMMPYVDMINHHHHKQADYTQWASRDEASEVVTHRRVKAGEQLYMSFGPRSTDKYLIYFGFVLESNPFDAMPLFDSFEEAARWHVARFGSLRCRGLEGIAHRECTAESGEGMGPTVKAALHHVETVGLQTTDARDWWDFIGGWAMYGYEILPYRPSPDVRPGGRVDPSLLSVFMALSDSICGSDSSDLRDGTGSATMEEDIGGGGGGGGKTLDPKWDPFCEKAKRLTAEEARRAEAELRKEQEEEEEREKDNGRSGEEKKARGKKVKLREAGDLDWRVIVAREAVVIRCREVLAAFASTIEEDEEILAGWGGDLGEKERGSEGEGGSALSGRMRMIIGYRLLRKRMLRLAIERMEGRNRDLGIEF